MARPVLLALFGAFFLAEASADTLQWDASPWSQEVTPCDLAAAHGADPDAIAPGVSQDGMDLAQAAEACEAAVAADPDNPRLRYQLARVYVYSGHPDKAEPHWEVPLAAEYPQALFVRGYMLVLASDAGSPDACTAEGLLRRSAQYGRLAAQIGYARYALDGKFDGCDPAVGPAALQSFLAAALASGSDYYRSMLIAMLQTEATAKWPPANQP